MDKLRQANIEWFRMCNTAITIRNARTARTASVKKTEVDEEFKTEESKTEESKTDEKYNDKLKAKINEETEKEIKEWNRNIFLL